MVSYQDALRYCRWRSEQEKLPPETYQLPTEAQWERAARGGYPDRLHPWGDVIRPDLCNTHEAGRGTGPCAWRWAIPTASGCLHMGDNVREWCLDCYSRLYYAQRTAPGPDPRGPAFSTTGALPGGARSEFPGSGRGARSLRGARPSRPPTQADDIGFRCVRLVSLR